LAGFHSTKSSHSSPQTDFSPESTLDTIRLQLCLFVHTSKIERGFGALSPFSNKQTDKVNSMDAYFQTFAQRMIGAGAVIVPILVAISALGGLSCHIMTSARLCFVGARQVR